MTRRTGATSSTRGWIATAMTRRSPCCSAARGRCSRATSSRSTRSRASSATDVSRPPGNVHGPRPTPRRGPSASSPGGLGREALQHLVHGAVDELLPLPRVGVLGQLGLGRAPPDELVRAGIHHVEDERPLAVLAHLGFETTRAAVAHRSEEGIVPGVPEVAVVVVDGVHIHLLLDGPVPAHLEVRRLSRLRPPPSSPGFAPAPPRRSARGWCTRPPPGSQRSWMMGL